MVIATGFCHESLYQIRQNYLTVARIPMSTWHNRLAHTPSRAILQMIKNGTVKGISVESDDEQQLVCDACEQGKSTRLPIKSRPKEKRSDTPGKVLHADLCGPKPQTSLQGFKYAMPIIDEHSRITTVIFLASKDQAAAELLDYIKWVKTTTGNRTAVLQTDNGGEFMSNSFQDSLIKKGIKHQTTIPYTPEQNGIAERATGLFGQERTMLLHSGLPEQYWQYRCQQLHISLTESYHLQTKENRLLNFGQEKLPT